MIFNFQSFNDSNEKKTGLKKNPETEIELSLKLKKTATYNIYHVRWDH